MSREINCKAVLKDNAISCNASLGQTVIVTEGPETYTGPVTVTPTEAEQTLLTKDKLLTDNVTVEPIPSEYTDAKADYDNALTAFGVEDSLADGISALTEYSNEITGQTDENLSDAVRSLADGYNPNGISIDDLCTGAEPSGDITVNADTIRDGALRGCPITGIDAPNCTYIGSDNFRNNTNLVFAHFPNCKKVGNAAFQSSSYGYDSDFISDFPAVETIDVGAFRECSFRKIVFPETLKSMSGSYTFHYQIKNRVFTLTEVYFRSKVTGYIHNQCFGGNNNLRDIYVPWSQGEVPNAPWGAQNATIHYDTVYDSEWNVVSST